MKKIFLFISVLLALASLPMVTHSQTADSQSASAGIRNSDFGGYIRGSKGVNGGLVPLGYGSTSVGWKDTLTDADTTFYTVTISGPKDVISFQVDVLKLTGTVAGSLRLEGSVNGSTWETALVVSAVTITDASVNYVIDLTNNAYKKYRLAVVGSGTNTMSNRCYLLYRKKP